MQIYVKKLASQLRSSKNNVGTSFSQADAALAYVDLLGKKSFQQNNSMVYGTALFFGFVAQVATAVSSYTFFEQLLAIKLSPTLLPVAVVGVLGCIELLKYVSVNKGLEGYFALPQRIAPGLLVFAALLCAVSMYASIVGGGHFGVDTQKIASTTQQFSTKQATIRSEINAILHRNTWKGQTYLDKKEKALVYAKEAELQALKQQEATTLQTITAENELAATQYRIGFAIFDALFLLCSMYVWYYRNQVALEQLLTEELSTPLPTVSSTVVRHDEPVPLPENSPSSFPRPNRPIGFRYDFTHLKPTNPPHVSTPLSNQVLEETAPVGKKSMIFPSTSLPTKIVTKIVDENRGGICCLHCQGGYVKNHHTQKYCSEPCRVAAWEQRTGKQVVRAKKK